MNKKTYEVNLSLYVLYEVVCNLYYSQYPSYPKDVDNIMRELMESLTKHVDCSIKYDNIVEDKYFREITYNASKQTASIDYKYIKS